MAEIAKSDNPNTVLGKYTENMKKALKKVTPDEKHQIEKLLDEIEDLEELEDEKKEEEVDEATGASSAGAYVGPLGYAKNEKNWRGASKTQWPGGKFVKVKEKCRKFPYCNQGDINALELWDSVLEKKIMRETIEKVSKKTGKPKKDIRKLIKKELDEIIRRSFYHSPITSLVGNFKINKPTGKIFSMVPKGVSNKYE
jgi:gas vesicle protein